VLEAEPLLELVHDYPEKRVLLRLARAALSRRGHGARRPAAAVVTVEELDSLALLEADGRSWTRYARSTEGEQEANVWVTCTGRVSTPRQRRKRT